MTLPRIYIETSVISYLTARPSRDLLVAARQEATREWWDLRDSAFHPLISSLVLEEASAGNVEAALKRISICQPLAHLPIDTACEQLARELIAAKALPATEQEDALHIALATLARVDFIATWNFAHLVGPVAKYRLQSHIERLGYTPPILATPEELLETLP
ncbi:MAG: type II toxin-antitoxin system VapC family toxin [Sulfuricellaceae bacterium]|nr:type II toxin-antitoxin system VapC family toxin [Sulfuricellaceae bacterium]